MKPIPKGQPVPRGVFDEDLGSWHNEVIPKKKREPKYKEPEIKNRTCYFDDEGNLCYYKK